jgi:uncharacterized protein
VIADATWISAEQRAAAAVTADSAAADLVQLQCTAPPALTARRMSIRTDSSSDADPWVATRMAAVQAPWPDAIIIDMSGSGPRDPASWPAELIQRALAAIRPHEPEYAA